MKTYEATVDSIGEGWSNPEETAHRWNAKIAPVLLENTTDEMQDNDDVPLISMGNGIAKPADEWAWEEFCGRYAGESDEATQTLADELNQKLHA
jgi:hypothetical protein